MTAHPLGTRVAAPGLERSPSTMSSDTEVCDARALLDIAIPTLRAAKQTHGSCVQQCLDISVKSVLLARDNCLSAELRRRCKSFDFASISPHIFLQHERSRIARDRGRLRTQQLRLQARERRLEADDKFVAEVVELFDGRTPHLAAKVPKAS